MKIRKLLIAMMILIMAVCIAACSNGDTSEGCNCSDAGMKNGMCTEDCECPDMKDGMCPEDCMCMKEMDEDKGMMDEDKDMKDKDMMDEDKDMN